MSIDMELRRLQEMGGATLLVSLPKDWTRTASVKKGSVVSIEESRDGGLLIYPVTESGEGHFEKEIEIQYPSRFTGTGVPSEITAAYLLGYDLIKIKGQHRISSQDREKIISSIKRLIGLEIVEEDAQSITSQFLVDNAAVEPDKIFKRISSIVRAMISDTIRHLTSEDPQQFESVAQRDDEVDRLHFLLVRLIRSAVREPRAAGKFGLSSIDCLDYRVAANSLETAGDYAVELSYSVSVMNLVNKELQKNMVEVSDLLDLIQDNAVRSFTARDFTLAQSVFQNYPRLERVLNELKATEGVPNILHVVDTIERIARCQRDVADLVSPMGPA
ncbi:MAG: PhoU domain-containing protein [Nitrososphaerales archaeon]